MTYEEFQNLSRITKVHLIMIGFSWGTLTDHYRMKKEIKTINIQDHMWIAKNEENLIIFPTPTSTYLYYYTDKKRKALYFITQKEFRNYEI